MKMKFAWSKTLEMKRREDIYQESDHYSKNEYQEYRATMKKVKRYRSAFTTEQVNYLEKEFHKYPYIGNSRRKDVANVLNIPERAVKIWFQNRRMKEKKDANAKETANEQRQAKTNIIDDLTKPAASVSNEPSLPVMRMDELKQHDNEVASDLRVNRTLPVSSNSDKNAMENYLKPKMSAVSTTSTKTSSDIGFFSGQKKECDIKIKSEANTAGVSSTSKSPALNSMFSISFPQKTHAVSPISISNLPQDLSSFTPITLFDRINHNIGQEHRSEKQQMYGQEPPAEQRNGQGSMENMNVPVYLRGYYAQPYIPPGNMIWKPINVAPIMSTGVPPVTVASSGPQQPSVPSRSCTCDCHLKQCSNPMVFQQGSPNLPVQYVITAVPLQNPSSKF